MNRIIIVSIAAFATIFGPFHNTVANSNSLPIVINPDIQHQEMDGFGAALSWFLGGLYRNNATRDAAIEQAMFEDLGLDILRLKNWYYPNDSDGNNAMNLHQINRRLFNAAKAANPDIKVLYSSWSPPESLKSNGDRRNGGTLARNPNGTFQYQQLANYWVEVLDNLGWTPDYLSFQNEPGYRADWESCLFQPNETTTRAGYAQALDAIWNAIKDRPDVPKIVGSEAENMPAFFNFNTPLKQRSFVDVHGYHVYDIGNPGAIDSTTTINRLRRIRDEFNDKPNWQTEFSREFNWIDAGRVIHNTLVEANASAYIYWKMYWGAGTPESMIEHVSNTAFQINPPYYTIKHYSKHIHQGHRRIEVGGGNSNVRVSGFLSPDGNQITLVAINRAASQQQISLTPVGFPIERIEGYQSVMGNFYQTMQGLNAANPVVLPASSMTTLVLSLVNGPVIVATEGDTPIANGDTVAIPALPATNITRTFTVANQGIDPLVFTGTPNAVLFAESGTTSHNNFTIESNIPSGGMTLQPGQSTQFTVAFESPTVGTFAATVSIANNDATNNPFTFTLEASTETYTVTFDGNGNTGGTVPSPQTKQRGILLTLSGNIGGLEKEDFIFSGWNTAPDGSGVAYAEGAAYTEDADVTLFARWRETQVFLTTTQPFNHPPGWTDGDYWSDGAPAAAGRDYSVFAGRAVHTPNSTATQTFPGDSLTLGNASTTGILRFNRTGIGPRTTIIGDLQVVRGRLETNNWGSLHTLQTNSGTLPVEAVLTLFSNSSDSQNRITGIIVDASLTGENVSIIAQGRNESPNVPNQIRLIRANPVSGLIRSINLCRLIVGHQDALQNLNLDMRTGDNGTVIFNQNSTVGGLTGTRDVDLGGHVISFGSNGQNTTYSGGISNGALTKTGLGTLTLSGTHAYTGPTLVTRGLLRLNGSLDAGSDVTLDDGAAIAGAGTINGNLTLTVGGAFLADGDALAVGGTVTLDPGSFLNAGDVDPEDGTPVVLMTYGSLAGTFGSVSLPSGWSLDYAFDGNSIALVVDDSNPYLAWVEDYELTGDDALPMADPDQDGLVNLQEFAFGTDPRGGHPGPLVLTADGDIATPGLPILMESSSNPGGPPFQAVFVRRLDAATAGLTYTVEFSADLAMWTTSGNAPEVLGDPLNTGPLEAVAVPFPASVPTATAGDLPSRFFRVRINGQFEGHD